MKTVRVSIQTDATGRVESGYVRIVDLDDVVESACPDVTKAFRDECMAFVTKYNLHCLQETPSEHLGYGVVREMYIR